MKKIFAIVILLSFVLTSTGCSKPKKDDTNQSTTTSSPSSEQSSEPERFEQSSIPSSAPESSEPEELAPAVAIEQNFYTETELAEIESLDNTETGWGQGVRVDDKNRPETCDPAQAKYGERGGLFIMPAEEPNVYLTFDEGYEAGFTPQILDALKEKEAPGVFFVTMDYVKKQPELIKRMIDEGHVIGNHSVRHKSMPTLTTAETIDEIVGLHNYMVENYNYQMTLFRPPEGKYSERTMQIAKDLGYKTVLWSFAYADFYVDKQIGVEKAFPKVTSMVHNGAIYLLHAVSKDNADMLADIIDDFRSKGFTIAKLT